MKVWFGAHSTQSLACLPTWSFKNGRPVVAARSVPGRKGGGVLLMKGFNAHSCGGRGLYRYFVSCITPSQGKGRWRVEGGWGVLLMKGFNAHSLGGGGGGRGEGGGGLSRYFVPGITSSRGVGCRGEGCGRGVWGGGGAEHSSQVHLYTRAAIISMIFCPDVHIMGLFWLPSCKYVGTVLLSLFSSPPKHSETEKLKTSETEVKKKQKNGGGGF